MNGKFTTRSQLLEAVENMLRPVNEEIFQLDNDRKHVSKILKIKLE